MRLFSFWVWAALIAFNGVKSQIQQLESNVIELNDTTFDSTLLASTTNNNIQGKSVNWLIFIGAKWCAYCRHFKAEFDILSTRMPKEHPEIRLRMARIDLDASPGLASRFLVTFLPSIFLIDEQLQVRTIDFSSDLLRNSKYTKRDADTFIKIIKDNVLQFLFLVTPSEVYLLY